MSNLIIPKSLKTKIFILPALLFVAASCADDDYPGCNSRNSATVAVEDKNYDNVSIDPPSLLDPNLPFRTFVPQFTYWLEDTGGNVVRGSEVVVSDNNATDLIPLGVLQPGSYRLTVWGNTPSGVPSAPSDAVDLHPAGAEGTDVYLQSNLLDYSSPPANPVVNLERTKGKLVVLIENLDPAVTRIEQSVTSVYATVDRNFSYAGSTTVDKSFDPAAARLATFIAPTVASTTSSLTLRFYQDADPTPVLTLSGIPQTFVRNQINLVQVDATAQEVWILINSAWEPVNDLIIVEN